MQQTILPSLFRSLSHHYAATIFMIGKSRETIWMTIGKLSRTQTCFSYLYPVKNVLMGFSHLKQQAYKEKNNPSD